MDPYDNRINSIRSTFDFDDRHYKPVLKPVSPSCSGDSYSHTSDESITKIQRSIILTKPHDCGFGFNIIGGTMGEGIYVSFILAGGAADQSKKIYKGDQLIKVNGHEVSRMSHSGVVQLLKASGNQVNLLLIYKPEEFRSCENHLQEFDNIMQSSGITKLSSYNTIGSLRTTTKKTLYVRTLFNYDVSKDCGLPNKGLSFKFGTILHVTNASDPEWWQARRVNLETGEDSTDLGIIPSKQRVERKNRSKQRKVRICMMNNSGNNTNNQQYSSSSSSNTINYPNNSNNISPNNSLTNTNSLSDQDEVNLPYCSSSSSSSSNNFITQTLGDMKLGSANSLPRSHHNGKQVGSNDNKKQTNGSNNNTNNSSSLFTIFKGSSSSSNNNNGGNMNSSKSKSNKNSNSLSSSSSNTASNNFNYHYTNGISTNSPCESSVDTEAQSDLELFYQPVIHDDSILYRPVIILGAFKEELNATLLKELNNLFGICIPHTTRPMGPDDINGDEFHFVSNHEMDRLISSHQFIETGRSGNYLYGTSVRSVLEVMESARHCLLDVSQKAVRRLGISGLWPIVLFIEPPIADTNSDSKTNSNTNSAQQFNRFNNNSYKQRLEKIRHDFLPYITDIISGCSNFESLYQKVVDIISLQNNRKIWLPCSFDL